MSEKKLGGQKQIGVMPRLALELEVGATNEGRQAATQRWKRQGNRLSPRASRKNTLADTLILAQ